MQSGGNLRHSNGEWRIANGERRAWVERRVPLSSLLSPFSSRGGRREGTRGVGWMWNLLGALLMIVTLSCKQTKEIAIPEPNANATLLYVLKILNIQPDDIDMNTEGTASATIFARLTDARGNPLANQVLFFEVLDVPGVSFIAAAQIQETTDERTVRFGCTAAGTGCVPVDCGPLTPLPPGGCPLIRTKESIKDEVKECTGTDAGTLPGSIFGYLSFRYRTTDRDGQAQSVFTSARVKKFTDLAFEALLTRAQACLGVSPESSTETKTEESSEDVTTGSCGPYPAPCKVLTLKTTVTQRVAISPINVKLLQSSFELPIRVRWNDPQYNLQVFDVRPLEVHIPQFWHD